MVMTVRQVQLWARSTGQAKATKRKTCMPGGAAYLEAEARKLARGSGGEGALSVWVQTDTGAVLWSAGEPDWKRINVEDMDAIRAASPPSSGGK